MEINDRVLFDASAYVLFEATGDSEAQHSGGDLVSQHSYEAADEDAQSCSHARSGKEVDGGDGDFRPRAEPDFDFGDRNVGGDDDGGGASDLEDGVVDQCRSGEKAAAPMEKVVKKSKGCCEESSVKMMTSEREGDRLFWEACLASQE